MLLKIPIPNYIFPECPAKVSCYTFPQEQTGWAYGHRMHYIHPKKNILSCEFKY